MSGAPRPSAGPRARVVISQSGPHGHACDAQLIARALHDAGHHVTYTEMQQTAEQVIATVVAEGALVLGLSICSEGHLTIVDDLIRLLDQHHLDDVRLVVMGVIPECDARELWAAGVVEVFTTGASTAVVVDAVNDYAGGMMAPS